MQICLHHGASWASLICHHIWQITLKWRLKVVIIHVSLIMYLSLQTFAINFDNLMTFLHTNQEFLYTNNIVWLIISTKKHALFLSYRIMLLCVLAILSSLYITLIIISIDKHSYLFLHCGITFWYVILFYFEFDSHIYIYLIYIYIHLCLALHFMMFFILLNKKKYI